MRHLEGQDTQALPTLLQTELEATQAANVDGMMAHRTEDFVSMPPNQPTIEGHEAVREFLGQMFSAFKPTRVNFDWKDVVPSGDVAYARGLFNWTLTPASGGDSIVDSGKMFFVMHRQNDGAWKMARAIWNSNGG